MTFREYLAQRRITDTPCGDFVQDARHDPTLPDIASWDALEGYLRLKTTGRMPVGVRLAARDVWRQYRRYDERHPTRS